MAAASRKPEENTKEAIGKRLDKYKRREPKEYKEYSDLPTWVRTVISMHDVLGLSWREACKRVGKSSSSIIKYKHSPAVAQWRKELKEFSQDAQSMAETTIKANALNVSLEYFAAYEKAIEANDYQTVAKISQDLLDRQGITKKKESKSSEKLQVTLNIGGSGTLDIPEVSATYEEVPEIDSDFEIVDD